jgi:mono/diheme cytochrome c family protein
MHMMNWLAALSLSMLVSTTAVAAPPSFSKDVQPFLMKYCVECHGNQKPKKGLNFASYESLMKGSRRKAVVVGKPQSSPLILTMTSRGKKKMPPAKYKNQPTAAEIAVIRAWIQAGAKDDSARGAAPARPKTVAGAREFVRPLRWEQEFNNE